jgi:hypothetical protein
MSGPVLQRVTLSFPMLPVVHDGVENTFLETLSRRSRNGVLSTLCGVFPCLLSIHSTRRSIGMSSEAFTITDLLDVVDNAQVEEEKSGEVAGVKRVMLQSVPGTFDWKSIAELELLAALWELCQCWSAQYWEWDVAFLNAVPTGVCDMQMSLLEKISFVEQVAKIMAPSEDQRALVSAGLWWFHLFDSSMALNAYKRHHLP